jgi:hypothetical protein
LLVFARFFRADVLIGCRNEAVRSGLFGTKIVLNGRRLQSPSGPILTALSPHTIAIVTFSRRFGYFPSIAIQIAVTGDCPTSAPSRTLACARWRLVACRTDECCNGGLLIPCLVEFAGTFGTRDGCRTDPVL